MSKDLVEFISKGPTPYQICHHIGQDLTNVGYKQLFENQEWQLEESGRYYVIRDDSSIIAFQLGKVYQERGFQIIGAHTDSPNLRVRANFEIKKEKYSQIAIEPYGGVLLTTWLDRDLGLAGRIMYRDSGKLKSALIDIKEPICRIPNLAIHLNPEVNKKGLVLNKQIEMNPILGVDLDDRALLKKIAALANTDVESIVSLDLALYDTLKPAVGGLNNEFIYSARLDNQAMCHAALEALKQVSSSDLGHTAMVALFNHEEVGSNSAVGAASSFLESIASRVLSDKNNQFSKSMAQSFLISADMAHAVHPNYAGKHGDLDRPIINHGPVIKINQNQRYATSAKSEAVFASICEEQKLDYQKYVHRSDMGCGSTIGPSMATNLGISTVDVGSPMLSMHSIREMAGIKDHETMIQAMQTYFNTDIQTMF